MKIKDLLQQEHSKKQAVKIIQYVGNDQRKFDELISFCFGDDARLAQRSSWPVSYCVEKHPQLAKKHVRKIVVQLTKQGHNAIRRNFTKMLEFIDIPQSLEADTISICFNLLNKKDEYIAVKVFSMAVLAKFCLKYPDLKEELIASIEAQYPFESAGFRARGRKIMKFFAQKPQRKK